MKSILTIVLVVLLTIAFTSSAMAASIEMNDGSKIPIDGLNKENVAKVIELMKIVDNHKASKATKEATTSAMKEVADTLKDSVKLDDWRKLITGTIKDVCSDLNVTSNEFIKTPVGMMVAGTLVYHFMGKDIIANVCAAVIMISGWCVLMMIWSVCLWYFFSNITVYDYVDITKDDKGKDVVKKSDPKRIGRYKWNSAEAKAGVGWFMALAPILTSIITVVTIM